MIDRTVATGNTGHQAEVQRLPNQMDSHDWYYRWLLFSNLQQRQEWQQKLLSQPKTTAAYADMLVKEERHACGLCEVSGDAVAIKQNPDTFPRLIQALDLGRLPPVFTEDELRKKVGLCNQCESKVKLLEEAEDIRGSLKESFISRLKQLSGVYNNNLSHHLPSNQHNGMVNGGSYGMAALQQTNEVTPDQHSMKRKISSYHQTYSEDTLVMVKRKHLVASPIPPAHSLPISPASVADSNNSSDEENIHMVLPPQANQMSPPISPRSSNGSYVMSPGTGNQAKVLKEVTSSRNRRKQARPAKAAGEVISDTTMHTYRVKDMPGTDVVPENDIYEPKMSNSPLLMSGLTGSMKPDSISPRPSPSPRQATSMPYKSNPATPKPPTPKPPTPKSTPSPRPSSNAYPPLPGLTLSNSTPLPATHASSNPALPFSSNLYQNMLAMSDRGRQIAMYAAASGMPSAMNTAAASTNHNSQNAMLLARQLYQAAAAAATQPLMGLQNQSQLAGKLPLPPFHNNPAYISSAPNGLSNLPVALPAKSAKKKASRKPSVKREPGTGSGSSSPLNFSLPASGSAVPSPVNGPSTSAASQPRPVASQLHPGVSEAHTLIKTEKRRYCKVCTAKCRKAKNGRPPQSRFLCLRCTMPMCRNCIEEHRFIMSQLPANGNGERSASARLLQAVSMRQRASTLTQKSRSTKPKPKPTSTLSPPSTSSILYASLSGQAAAASTSTASTSAASTVPPSLQQPVSANLSDMSQLGLASQNAPAQRATEYPPIAPAPPKPADTVVVSVNMADMNAADTSSVSSLETSAPERPNSNRKVLADAVNHSEGDEGSGKDSEGSNVAGSDVPVSRGGVTGAEVPMDARDDSDDDDAKSFVTMHLSLSEDEDDDDFAEDRLVISESESPAPSADNETVITPQVASETVAMLDSNIDSETDQHTNKPVADTHVCAEAKPSRSPAPLAVPTDSVPPATNS